MRVVRSVLGGGRRGKLGSLLALHLAVEAAAAVVVPAATRATAWAATGTAPEAPGAATSTLMSLLALVVGVAVAGVVGVLARWSAVPLGLSPCAIVPLLALATLLAYAPTVGFGVGVSPLCWGEETAGDGLKDLVGEFVGAVVQGFQGKDRHGVEGCKNWLRREA